MYRESLNKVKVKNMKKCSAPFVPKNQNTSEYIMLIPLYQTEVKTKIIYKIQYIIIMNDIQIIFDLTIILATNIIYSISIVAMVTVNWSATLTMLEQPVTVYSIIQVF